jgi:ribonuclease HII
MKMVSKIIKGKKTGYSKGRIRGMDVDKMPINLGEYYNCWKNIKNVYTKEKDFHPLREKMLEEVFDDSKQLKAIQREQIFDRIEDCRRQGFLVHESRVLTPLEISELMTRDERTNLNKMSHDTVVDLIRKLLDQGINITRVFVDTVGPPTKYEDFLRSKFPNQSI